MAVPGFPSLDYTTSRTWKRQKSLITNESFKASRALVLLTKVEKKLAGKIVPRCTHFTGASPTSFPCSLLRLLTPQSTEHWNIISLSLCFNSFRYIPRCTVQKLSSSGSHYKKKKTSDLHFILARRGVELQIPLVWFMRLPHDLKFLYPGDRLNFPREKWKNNKYEYMISFYEFMTLCKWFCIL